MHLKAASSLSFKFRRDQLKECPLSNTRRLAVEFFTGVITWYDVLSCVSTGQKPFSNFGDVDEDAFSPIQFDKLMGCESWLVHLIGEIATLSDWKRRMEATGTLSTWELVRRVTDIEMRLETGLINSSRLENGSTTMDVPSSKISSNSSESLIQKITRIFAGGALVYLQVIVSGPYPALPEIQQGVSRTMAALNALPDKELLRNLLWPVCIAGCMAKEENESYWRDLISNVSQDRWSFGYPSKVLRIMEECWQLRKRQPGTVLAVDWMMAMNNLDMKVLLV
jgi:C6 transcription factor Pro1